MTAGTTRRVLLLVDRYVDPYGGSEGQIHALLSGLPPEWRAEMWTLQPSPWPKRHAFPCPTRNVGIRALARPGTLCRIHALGRAVRRRGFDLVHTWMNDASVVGPLLGARAGVPVLVSRRDLGFWQTPRDLAVLRRTNRLTRGVVANCQAVGRHTVQAEHVPPSSITVVPNGHDRQRFDVEAEAGARARLDIPEDALLVGLLANVKPLKRHRDLLEAVAALGGAHPDLHVLLIGSVVASGVDIGDHVRRLSLEGRVHLEEALGNAIGLLKHVDVGVLCSETEGLSNAILEYMACSLPVVATNVGGNPDLVTDGENGFLVEPTDTAALADRIGRLARDPDLRNRMGRASRRRYENAFTLERLVERTTDLWETTIASAAAGPPSSDGALLSWEVITDLAAIESLADDWDALLGPDHLFLGPDWVLSWMEHGALGVPHVLVARGTDGALAGLLPLVESRGVLGFAGQGEGADHLDVVAAEGQALAVARGALTFLTTLPWRRLRFLHMAEDGALRRALHELRWKLPYRERLATVCPYVEVPATEAPSYDDYVAHQFSYASRRNIRRYPRRYRALEGARVERVADPAGAAAGVDRFYALHDARFDAQGETSAMAPARVRAFHRALAVRAAASGRLAMTFLVLADRDVACEYAFRHGGKLYAFQSGLDTSAPFESPGLVLQAIVLEEDVFGGGLAEYDFLDGTESYKLRWATTERRLFNVEIHRPTSAGRAACLAHGAARIAYDLLRGRAG